MQDTEKEKREDEAFMAEAIREARKAYRKKETPIGCVIVRTEDGKIIARGRNRRDATGNVLAHAEIEAIRKACRKMHDWRLEGCTMYVTLEPCPMCAGAIINSRIKTVYFGAYDSKAGSFGSVEDFSRLNYPHKPEIIGGVMEKECEELLSDFFKTLRQNKPR